MPDADAPERLERRIRECTERIWLHEPEDLTRLCAGIVDSGAGSKRQYFTTLLFAQSEVRGLTYNASVELLQLADDPAFALPELKKIAKVLFTARAGFLNYVGMHELGGLFQEYLEVIDVVEDRETFVRLSNALRTYGVRVHLWTEQCFPWEVGAHMVQVSDSDARWLADQTAAGPWIPVPYLTG
jgi:hypothetical protein